MARRTPPSGCGRPEFSVDKAALLLLPDSAMAQLDKKLVTPFSLLIDVILVAAFFTLMFTLLKEHVPSNDPKMIALWGGLASACMSGVFWLCIQMFRLVYRAQKEAKK